MFKKARWLTPPSPCTPRRAIFGQGRELPIASRRAQPLFAPPGAYVPGREDGKALRTPLAAFFIVLHQKTR